MKATDEQVAAIDQAKRGDSFKIMAYAGSGKTTTLKLISEQLAGQKGLYLAFNKAIADEARSKFPPNVDCRTFHSMAYRHVDRKITDKLRLPRLSPLTMARDYQLEPLSIRRMLGKRYEHFTLTPSRQAGLISNAVSRFCATHARHPAPRHLELPDWLHPDDAEGIQQQLFPHVEQRWHDALDPYHQAGINHEVYLKCWALADPIIPVDYILFDEAQDSDPLMLGILMQQKRAQVIYVGDAHQQIYQWRGAVNAMQKLPLPDTRLTRSFRFGDAVAEIAQPEIVVTTYAKNENVVVCVEDNGSGFDTEMLSKAFEPYITSKATGTGLGLAVVKKIIAEHKGEVTVGNRKEGGATITIVLPLLEA